VLKVSGVDKFQRETEQILEVTYKKWQNKNVIEYIGYKH
jgi:hypothetical protein